eukprot:TRINITY_DN5216_c0_g1_i2.p1 TRINITY_DN5216_c0_g1~~TRINITY_DN5216_c0_g1_i2.p1  ORF type:complete len:195 (-),score=46.84 TRINITY_DN5216_c0_g1_i2:609-1193(-)
MSTLKRKATSVFERQTKRAKLNPSCDVNTDDEEDYNSCEECGEDEGSDETQATFPKSKPHFTSKTNIKLKSSTDKIEKSRDKEERERKKKEEKRREARKTKFAFLENPLDEQKRPHTDPNYDPRTLHIPRSSLISMTNFERQYWEIKRKCFDTIVFFKKAPLPGLVLYLGLPMGGTSWDIHLIRRALRDYHVSM